MDLETKIAELEREVASLRAALARKDVVPPNEDAMVARLLRDREVLSHVPDVITILDREHRCLYINRVVPGRTVEELIGARLTDFLVAAEREASLEALERAWTTGEIQTVETRSLADYVRETRIVPIVDEGRVAYVLAIAVDITARKRAEDALRESHSRLRHAIEATGMGTWIRDEHGVRWDDALCRIMGVDPADVPSSYDGFLPMIHPEDRAHCAASIERFRATGVYQDVECRVVRPDGSIRHVIAKGSVELDAHGSPVRSYGGIFDVTERKLLEEQLRQAQKMDAIGHLTAGIAHNFNNILGIILPNAELGRAAAPPELTERLDDILHATERGAEMIRQLMVFARRDSAVRKEPVDVAACTRRTAGMCRATFGPGIAIEVSIAPGLPTVLGNAGQIEQALLNILLNARDALEAAQTRAPRIVMGLERSGAGWVRIRVSDNGPGMSEETRARAFDPFFTTKDVRHGTGLGLATLYAIVLDHGGRVRCESVPGQGAMFEIELPPADEAASHVDAPRELAAVGGSETLLLVDDELLVRRAARALLERGGYTVLEAADGASALETVEHERDHVAAVLLDRSMPGISGEQVLARLADSHPSLPVIVVSGHLGGTEGWERAAAVLTKPVSAATLLRTVRAVLDGERVQRAR